MLKYVAALIASIAAMLVMAPTQTNAAYNSSNLISNSVFRQSNTMDANQIQNFLASKGSGLANKKWGSQRAADIINKAAKDYGINPRVILATLQKEQSLITDPSPDSIQLRSAMGYGCPDSGTCASEYSGFSYQIENGTWQLRFNYERANGNNSWWNSATNYACKQKDTQHNPPFYNAGLFPGNTVTFSSTGGKPNKTIKIANAATASLYCYTPHVGPYSATGYSGSYNFVISFESWFGSTQGNPGYAAIIDKYNSMGGASSWLGASTSDIKPAAKSGLYQLFTNGKILWHKNTGAWAIRTGAVSERFAAVGYEGGYLGFPRSNEVSIPGKGIYQVFEGSQMYWSSSTGAWDVRLGAMFNRFAAVGYEGGYLGFPTSGEVKAKSGVYQSFQGGRLYWRPGYQAMDMNTNIIVGYASTGYENSYLGLPNNSTSCGLKDGGCWMRFDGGKIYWSSASGVYDVHAGAVDNKYAELNWEGGKLGYPIGREVATGTTCGRYKDIKQEFQGGTIYWSACSSPQVRVEFK